jgi:uncharacterized protein (DUF488 family)
MIEAVDPKAAAVVHTIGHSTRSIEDFIGLLHNHAVEMIADVRTVPRSRFNPQFNRDALPASLAGAGIGYQHLLELGGLRRTTVASENRGWRNASFRGFADYMLTDQFQNALQDLLTIAQRRPTAIMCAEVVPWRCHRSLIADALLVHGHEVVHIIGARNSRPHTLTTFLRFENGRMTYPPPDVDDGAAADGRGSARGANAHPDVPLIGPSNRPAALAP